MTQAPLAKTKRVLRPIKRLQPNAALTTVVGTQPLTRVKLLKALWRHIKKNNLRVPGGKIKADAKLLPIFGGQQQISMFDLHKLIEKHWTECAP